MKTHLVIFQPGGLEVRVEAGTRIYDAALKAGLRLITLCGGKEKCGRCKVRVLGGTVRPALHTHLSQGEIDTGYCLACATAVDDDLVVEIPREMEVASTAGTQALLSMAEILETARALRGRERATGREGEGERTREGEGARAKGRAGNLGLALDIGTTVVAGALFDLNERELLAEAAAENLQAAHGADIVHRINFAKKGGGLRNLQHLGLETVEGIVGDLLATAGESIASILAVTAAGNTTMTHLLLGMDPAWIQTDSLPPSGVEVPQPEALESGIPAHPSAGLWVSPWVGNYLGGDITAGVLFTRMWNEEPLTLYVDLGTNGEIVLGNREWMAGCACSCGPAFEGSGVSCGVRAAGGAIDRVEINSTAGGVLYRTIGKEKPNGICGSGLLDVLAQLRQAGLVDQRGKFITDRLNASGASGRVQGRPAFVVAPAEHAAHGADIVVTQRDLEHLIRSKGAAFAGIRTLLKNLDISPDQIQRVVIAGGFGRSLDIPNAIAIGMLPDLPLERFSYIGNGSLKGAVLALLWEDFRDRIADIARKITYVDLSTTPGYMDEFVASLFLPHTDLGLFPSVK
ncbi:MAG: DUF4445 domain-containing protein [Candidatus Eisenbacteria sp.]|nr:DUF4445 domain-containing protein [Candidatus Eisenbacteria bacterium]